MMKNGYGFILILATRPLSRYPASIEFTLHECKSYEWHIERTPPKFTAVGTAVPKYLYGCALSVLVLRYPCYLYRLKFSSATARALPRPWYTCTTSTTLVQYKYCKVLCYNGRSSTFYYMYFYFHHFKVSYYNT